MAARAPNTSSKLRLAGVMIDAGGLLCAQALAVAACSPTAMTEPRALLEPELSLREGHCLDDLSFESTYPRYSLVLARMSFINPRSCTNRGFRGPSIRNFERQPPLQFIHIRAIHKANKCPPELLPPNANHKSYQPTEHAEYGSIGGRPDATPYYLSESSRSTGRHRTLSIMNAKL